MIAALILAAATNGPDKPVRSLAYAFTATSGATAYNGTISADVLGITTDGGLVIRFAQNVPGQTALTFPRARCVVYADTRVDCMKDQKNVSPVETELARLMGRNFVDGNNLDADNHWRLAGPLGTGSETDDFTVTANNNGILSITETREVSGPAASHHTATISYDMANTVPVSVKYTDAPKGGDPANVQINLTSDSLKKSK
jgi:hypothetical protein